MLKKAFCGILSVLISNLDSFGQDNWKSGFFNSAADFMNQTPVDSCSFSYKPISDLRSKAYDRAVIPEHYRLIPKNSQLPVDYFNSFSCLAYDGESLFINLKMLRMSPGFVRIDNPSAHNFFIGIPQKYVSQGSGLVSGTSGWVSQDGPIDQRELKPYVYSLTTGRVHSFIPSTLERLLEPYPELLQLYLKDPNWNTLESMKVYIGILNELLKTEEE